MNPNGSRAPDRYCFRCGTPWVVEEITCHACGSSDWSDGEAMPVMTPNGDVQRFGGPWHLLPWPGQGTVGMFGGPGAGKSSLAAMIRPTVWLTKEQVPKPVGDLFRRLWPATDTEDAFMPTVRTVESRALITTPVGPVVLDSATALGLREGLLASHHLVEWAREHNDRTLCVIQVTKGGDSAGYNEIPHLFDAIINVTPDSFGVRAYRITKSRWSDLGSTYWTFNESGRVAIPDFPAAYSVEGAPGEYWLQPFPMRGGKWHEFLAALSSDDKLLPKMASSAIRAPYMPTGFITPMDTPARKRFAEVHGLNWISPGDIELSTNDS
jgi:hypothetical protein